MNRNFHNIKQGFTLLEMLLVVGIIAILSTIVVVAINPGKQLATANNTVRKSDLVQISNAMQQYFIDHYSYPASTTPTTLTEICNTGNHPYPSGVSCGSLIDLSPLVPTYISQIPVDPSGSTLTFINNLIPKAYASTNGTGYKIAKDQNNKIILTAPEAQLGAMVAIGTTTATTTGGGGSELTIMLSGSYRLWSDSTYAVSCKDYRFPSGGKTYSGDTGSGFYRIDPDGAGGVDPFDVYCNMDLDGGGWTLVLKAASTGTTFAYDSSYWTNDTNLNQNYTNGDPSNDSDMKSTAFSTVSFTGYLVSVHTVSNYFVESVSSASMKALVSAAESDTTSNYTMYKDFFDNLTNIGGHSATTNGYKNGTNMIGSVAESGGSVRIGASSRQSDPSWGVSWGVGLAIHSAGIQNYRGGPSTGEADPGWVWVR